MIKKEHILIFCVFLLSILSLKAVNNSELIMTKNLEKDKPTIIFKGETRETIMFDENNNPQSNFIESISYHIVNLNSNNVTFFYQRKGNNEWFNQSFEFNSIEEKDGVYEMEVNSEICRKIYFELNKLSTLTYSFNNGMITNYENLKRLPKEDFDRLGIYDWAKTSNDKIPKNEIQKYQVVKDFEYSEHWRKEAFKKSIAFIQNALSEQKPKCTMTKRSAYNPVNVKYIGNQGMSVKFYAEYDCNQDYINPAYFKVNAYYSGKGEWSFELKDHKLTH